MTDADDVLASERIIRCARLLEPGDKLDFAHSRYEFRNPMQVVDVDIVEWDAFTTATIEMNQGINSFGDPNHDVVAVEGEPPRWQHPSNDDGFVVKFDPHDYNDTDIAAVEFAERIEKRTWRPGCSQDSDVEVKTDGGHALTGNTMSARVPCRGCGGSVTQQYARVYRPEREPDHVDACPDCEYMVRDADGSARPNSHLAAGRGDD